MKPVMNHSFRSEKGITSVMMAVLLPVIIGFLGLAVDAGNIFMTKIRLQNVADSAALSAIGDIENSQTIVESVVAENGLDPDTVAIVRGVWDNDAHSFVPAEEGEALRVRLEQNVSVYFLRIVGVPSENPVSAEATAALKQAGAVVGLGATTLDIDANEGIVLNALIGNMLGTTLDLSAVGWEGIADANLDLVRFLNLAKVRLNAADMDGVLNSELSLLQMLDLMIELLEADSSTAAAYLGILREDIAGSVAPINTGLRLGDMLQLDTNAGALAKADVNLLSLLMASAQLFNHTSGVMLSTDVPLGSLLDLSLKVRIIEPPVIKIMQEGSTIHAAGARVYLNAQALSLLGGSPIIHLPLYLELGSGDATLGSVSEEGVDLQTTSSLLRLFIGGIDENIFFTDETLDQGDFSEVSVVNVPLLYRVDARGFSAAAGGEETLHFTPPFPQSSYVHGELGSAVGNLLDTLDLDLTPTLLGILPLPSGLVSTVTSDILGIMSPLFTALLDPVSMMTGVFPGRTDVTVYDYAYEAALVN